MGLMKCEDQLKLEGQWVIIDEKGEMLMDEDKTVPRSKKVQLLEKRGPTSRFIHARIEDNGSLVIEGQDVGEAPLKWFDDEDYEFWVTVRAEDKDSVILVLIEKLFAGRFRAIDEFREFLKEKGIPFGWMTWA